MGKRSQTVTFTTPNEVRIDQQARPECKSASSGLEAPSYSIDRRWEYRQRYRGSRLTFSGHGFRHRTGQAGREIQPTPPASSSQPDIPRKTTTQPGIRCHWRYGQKPKLYSASSCTRWYNQQARTGDPDLLDRLGTRHGKWQPDYLWKYHRYSQVRAVATGTCTIPVRPQRPLMLPLTMGKLSLSNREKRVDCVTLPLSRKPIPIGKMASSSSSLAISYAHRIIRVIVFNKVGQRG